MRRLRSGRLCCCLAADFSSTPRERPALARQACAGLSSGVIVSPPGGSRRTSSARPGIGERSHSNSSKVQKEREKKLGGKGGRNRAALCNDIYFTGKL